MRKWSVVWKLSKDELEKLVKESDSFTKVLKFFGLSNKGGQYRTLKRRLDYEHIDYSHIRLGLNHNKGRSFPSPKNTIPLDQRLVENSTYSRGHLKERLIKNNILENKCSICGQLPDWEEKPLVMVLDHINGKPTDNRLENLRLLCPNCNSQTETFCGRQRKKIYNCLNCGKIIIKGSKLCHKCNSIQQGLLKRKVQRPSKEELEKLVWEKSTIQLAKDFGVSDKAVEKWCKKEGINKPPRGYWAKIYAQKS